MPSRGGTGPDQGQKYKPFLLSAREELTLTDCQDGPIVELVIPELERGGLFRTAYEGRTSQEILGLPRPDSRCVNAPATGKAAE